jgi:uroporphyrinogen-III decarboxylase
MPVGTDLVLHEKGDRQAILLDGSRLGAVIVEAAQRYRTPLAFPLMDLTIEKQAIAGMLKIPSDPIDEWHLFSALDADAAGLIEQGIEGAITPRMLATCDALRWVDANSNLVPVGMSIGPFSLMTKLVPDPITPVFMAGAGETAEDDEEVALIESALGLAERIIAWWLRAQAEAGAKAVFICEPAANIAFFSPLQMEQGSDIFDRYVMTPNRRLKALLDELNIDLIFHDCGELTDSMVSQIGSLRPRVLSFGSSRKLWEDAALVPKDVVLYGNLPSKRFNSDELVSVDQVSALATDLVARMKAAGHPFILGSECDVLAVPGSEDTIRAKVEAFLTSQ